MKYPLDFNFKTNRQKLTNAITVESSRYGNIIMELLLFFADVFTAIFFISTAIYMSPIIFSVCSLLGFFIYLLNKKSYETARKIGSFRIKAQELFFSFISDILLGMKEIKINSSENKFFSLFKSNILPDAIWRFDNKWNAYKIIIVTQSVVYFILFIVITLGIHVINLNVTLLITFLILIGRLQRVVTTMQNHYLKIKQNLPSLKLIDDLLNIKKIINFKNNNKIQINKISLKNVSFSYPNSNNILSNVSLDFDPGDRVLLQGESGEGKSTFFKLLSGFLKPSEGKIFFSHKELNESYFYKLRPNISYISADSHIFRGSIKENLDLIGDFSKSEINKAIINSKLDTVINKIKGGIKGNIGENGSSLSLGERQRVLVAQIFLQKSQIIFLDETTSNLDIGFENDIIRNLFKSLRGDSILFFIAHKKPYYANFNKKLILKKGKIINQ
tara:strand:+ start:4 stop:1338 length:1335 start_codon:yes stop_codon:yes gene_type:complete